MRRRYYFFLCLFFSLWTIVQTACHLVFSLYAYLMSVCVYSPKEEYTIFFYLTYLYSNSCKKPVLNAQNATMTSFPAHLEHYVSTIFKITTNSNSTLFVEELLHHLDAFPEQANAYTRTAAYFTCILIADILWITAAFALLMGTSCGVKNTLSLLFYVPWLITTALVALLDVTMAVHFGLDIAETTNFANWQSFVGISKPLALQSDVPVLLPMAPSVTMCAIGVRFVLVWIVNVVAFVFVLKATSLVYRGGGKSARKPRNNNNYGAESPVGSAHAQFNSTAARIRNWQLFYGAGGESRTTSASNEAIEGGSIEVREPLGSNYYAYSDVCDGTEDGLELKRHLPWSYTHQRLSDDDVRIEPTGRRSVRIVTANPRF